MEYKINNQVKFRFEEEETWYEGTGVICSITEYPHRETIYNLHDVVYSTKKYWDDLYPDNTIDVSFDEIIGLHRTPYKVEEWNID